MIEKVKLKQLMVIRFLEKNTKQSWKNGRVLLQNFNDYV